MAISSNTTGLRPGVCTSTSRPSSPYEGQMIYETDTDLTYVWGGSAWQQVSGGTAVGNSGLVYITQASATSGPTLSVNNCFSSTYSNYRILIDNFQPAIVGRALNIRMRANGSDAQTADYYHALTGIYTDGSSSNDSGTARTSAELGIYNSANTVGFGTSSIDIFGPNRAERTYMTINAILYNNQFGSRVGLAEHNLTNAYTGFTLLPSGGDFLNVRVWVYGYRNS